MSSGTERWPWEEEERWLGEVFDRARRNPKGYSANGTTFAEALENTLEGLRRRVRDIYGVPVTPESRARWEAMIRKFQAQAH